METCNNRWGWPWWLLGFLAFAVVVLVLYRTFCPPGQVCRCNYRRVQVGMTVADVESLLGPGQEIPEEEVPGVPAYVKPMRKGRSAPIIEGDLFYRWDDGYTEVYVGFKGHRVHEKVWLEPSL
jgi:hypothetical protein